MMLRGLGAAVGPYNTMAPKVRLSTAPNLCKLWSALPASMDEDSQTAHWHDAGYAKTDCAHTAGRMGELSTESTAKLLFSRRLLKDAVKDGGSKLLEDMWFNSESRCQKSFK